jgi:hypothetical protein
MSRQGGLQKAHMHVDLRRAAAELKNSKLPAVEKNTNVRASTDLRIRHIEAVIETLIGNNTATAAKCRLAASSTNTSGHDTTAFMSQTLDATGVDGQRIGFLDSKRSSHVVAGQSHTSGPMPSEREVS